MNRCTQIQELIPWYIEGGLTKSEERDVAEHLTGCGRCRDDLVVTMRLRLDVRAIIEESPGPSQRVRERVAQRAFGRKLAQLDVGSFFLGLSLGASLRNRDLPLRGDLSVMGRRIRLFNTERRRGGTP
jgi:predicted anti-sigma-YlaC factor YlaD